MLGANPLLDQYIPGHQSLFFNLSNNKKFDFINNSDSNAIYKSNSYGPTFGGGHDLYLANSCKSNTNSYCSKNTFNTGETNLLGNKSSTSFQVSNYEVYQVIFE